MNNQEALNLIDNCKDELKRIFHLIEGHGRTSNIVPFLTNYAIVKSCGTVENCFKTIIADIHSDQSPQVVNYVDNTIRNSSMNPSMNNICNTLNKFDKTWNTLFKKKLETHTQSQQIRSSLDSLNNARNAFAHGRNPSSSFENIQSYFNDTVDILEILDEVVNTNKE